MIKKPTTFQTFGFNPKNPTYFATLGVNQKKEFFFHFLWDKNLLPSYYYDAESKKEENIFNIDHLSFHRDGTVHIRYHPSTNKEDKIIVSKLKNSLENLPSGFFAPLLIYSIYNIDDFAKFCGMSITPFEKLNNQNINLDIANYKSLSLIPILFSPDVDPIKILEAHYSEIFKEYIGMPIYNIFGDESKVKIQNGKLTEATDLGLLIAVTPKVLPFDKDSEIMSKEKRQEFSKILGLTGLNIFPSDQKINSLI